MELDLERVAKAEGKLRPFLTSRLPEDFVTKLYSRGREEFIERLDRKRPEPRQPPEDLKRTLWDHDNRGVEFRAPLMNAAGMWKNGGGYEVSLLQGAGGHLVGTTTFYRKDGYEGHGIKRAFTPYPRSGAASNTLGLPNDGHQAVAQRISTVATPHSYPLGASVMRGDDLPEDESMKCLIGGMWMYDRHGVDWIEVNESCPNTGHGELDTDGLKRRLGRMRKDFIDDSDTPVVVKLSVDTEPEQAPELVDLMWEQEIDGINLGNTRKDYDEVRDDIHRRERPLFDDYTEKHGGGVSGQPLKDRSLMLSMKAARHVEDNYDPDRFTVWRTGGVETAGDIEASMYAGVDMCQWFTGYFEGFAERGHDVYRGLFEELS